MKLNKNRVIRTILGNYHRALETANFIYFVNFEESDENGAVKMYDRKMNLVSDNYFACEDFSAEVRRYQRNKGKYRKANWVSKKLSDSLLKSK